MYLSEAEFITRKGQSFFDKKIKGVLTDAEATARYAALESDEANYIDSRLAENYSDFPIDPVPGLLKRIIADRISVQCDSNLSTEQSKELLERTNRDLEYLAKRTALLIDGDEAHDELETILSIESGIDSKREKLIRDLERSF